ncbi:DUF4097 family beta strand repeat-containing protein [Oceanobacillus sp. CAU 1775]
MVNLFKNKKEPVIQENTVKVSQIKEFEIHSDIVNIEFIIHDKAQVDITLETFEKGPELQMSLVNDRLVVEAEIPQKKRILNIRSGEYAKLEIRLPEDFAEHYKIKSATGNIKAKNLIFETMLMKTGAGNIDATNFHGKDIELRTGAGNIFVENIDSNRLEVDTGAGSVNGKSCSGKIVAKSGAGNVRFQVAGNQDLEMKSGAGNVHVDFMNLEELNATIRANVGLGNIVSDLPNQQGGTQKSNKLSIILGEGTYNHEFKSGVGSIYLMGNE